LDRLIEDQGQRILNYLLQMTGNRHDAEDLTQDTFVKAFKSAQRGQRPANLTAWLLTIARRTALNHFRAARPTENLSADVPFDSADPALVAAQTDDHAQLWAVARRLKRICFEALWLRYAEGLSVAETARVLGRHPIHVRVLLHRARMDLRRRLPEFLTVPVQPPSTARPKPRTAIREALTQRRVA
jgi:RNA polymerase sigma-70 factor (ECF subfamily)